MHERVANAGICMRLLGFGEFDDFFRPTAATIMTLNAEYRPPVATVIRCSHLMNCSTSVEGLPAATATRPPGRRPVIRDSLHWRSSTQL